MDPNFSRKNVYMYHDNPSEAPLIVATVKYVEKHCNITLSHIKAREVGYAKPLLILICPIVNKTDQDVNALLDSSRDGSDVMVIIVKRALERAKHKDSLAHLSDPLSTSTRNRVGAACTLYFSGREKFKGYKNENGMAIHEVKRVVNHSLESKPWATTFPVIACGDHVDGTSRTASNAPRQIQFVASSSKPGDPRPIQFVQSTHPQQQELNNNQQQNHQSNPFSSQPTPAAIPAPQGSPSIKAKPLQIPEIKISPPGQTGQVPDPFLAPMATQNTSTQSFDDFFDPRADDKKPSANPFGDAFNPQPGGSAEMLHFEKPAAPQKEIRSPVYYFFDNTSPLEKATVDFLQGQGKIQLKACRRQTAAIVTPLVIFSPCYSSPDADALSVLGQCRDGEDVFLVVIEPVKSQSSKQQASLSDKVRGKIGSYGVLSYCMDTKSYVATDENSVMMSKMKDFIIERQELDPPEDDEEDEEEDDDDSPDVLILEGFNELGFDESDA